MKIQPEHVRREWANRYAELQILKLKVAIVIGILALLAHWGR